MHIEYKRGFHDSNEFVKNNNSLKSEQKPDKSWFKSVGDWLKKFNENK